MRSTCKPFIVLAVLGGLVAAAPPAEPLAEINKEYDRAIKEQMELEHSFMEERVKARIELETRKEESQTTERETTVELRSIDSRIDTLKGTLQKLTNPTSERALPMWGELEKLQKAKEGRKQALLSARRQLIGAEENLSLLDRQQDLQRRKVRVQVEAAEAKLRRMLGVSADDSAQRFHELERKIDSLTREIKELRQEVRPATKTP